MAQKYKEPFRFSVLFTQVSSVAQQGGIDKLTPIKVDVVDFCGDGKQSNVIGAHHKLVFTCVP